VHTAGTGKTTAVVEAVLQEVARGNSVLCCSASNVAVDNVVERVSTAAPKLHTVRVGHPARLVPAVLSCSLEAHVLRSDNSRLAADCRGEIKQLNRRLLKLGKRDYAERREIRGELRRLGKEEKQRQSLAVTDVLSRAHVVCCTLAGIHAHSVRHLDFDVVFVDEAAQALEVACWGAMLRAHRAILAGLPPTADVCGHPIVLVLAEVTPALRTWSFVMGGGTRVLYTTLSPERLLLSARGGQRY
jgi:ATP-dependent RNA/DNA helicase IGHMBP2